MPDALNLHRTDLVATGVQRAVYLHPLDPTKLIKVLRPATLMPKRNNFNGIMDRLLPGTRLRQIRKEYGEYLRIMLRNTDPGFHTPIAHMFGFTPTDKGLGCVTERVMQPDGAIGETLGALVRDGRLTQAHIDLLNNTIARIYAYDIRASDMNPDNFVFGHRDNGTGPGDEECVLVDGFGDIHAIPVRSMARWSNRLGLDDSCIRLARNTGLIWDKKARTFSLAQ